MSRQRTQHPTFLPPGISAGVPCEVSVGQGTARSGQPRCAQPGAVSLWGPTPAVTLPRTWAPQLWWQAATSWGDASVRRRLKKLFLKRQSAGRGTKPRFLHKLLHMGSQGPRLTRAGCLQSSLFIPKHFTAKGQEQGLEVSET